MSKQGCRISVAGLWIAGLALPIFATQCDNWRPRLLTQEVERDGTIVLDLGPAIPWSDELFKPVIWKLRPILPDNESAPSVSSSAIPLISTRLASGSPFVRFSWIGSLKEGWYILEADASQLPESDDKQRIQNAWKWKPNPYKVKIDNTPALTFSMTAKASHRLVGMTTYSTTLSHDNYVSIMLDGPDFSAIKLYRYVYRITDLETPDQFFDKLPRPLQEDDILRSPMHIGTSACEGPAFPFGHAFVIKVIDSLDQSRVVEQWIMHIPKPDGITGEEMVDHLKLEHMQVDCFNPGKNYCTEAKQFEADLEKRRPGFLKRYGEASRKFHLFSARDLLR